MKKGGLEMVKLSVFGNLSDLANRLDSLNIYTDVDRDGAEIQLEYIRCRRIADQLYARAVTMEQYVERLEKLNDILIKAVPNNVGL